jgi:hypothetical protein
MITIKPFKETSDKFINMFNEIMNSSYLLILLSLSGQETVAEIKEQMGWSLVCISLLTVFINLLKLIQVNGKKILRVFINKCLQKVKKHTKSENKYIEKRDE